MLAVRAAGLVGAAAVLVGCSSGSGSPVSGSSTASPTSPSPGSSGDGAKQAYLDAVDQLCDELLPRVVKATHGGSIDVAAAEYVRDWPGHHRLLTAFDADLAGIPVPPSARPAAEAFADYVRYADGLDAARLAAARHGQAAYRAEVRTEESAPLDPSVTARTAAGFHQSCDAR